MARFREILRDFGLSWERGRLGSGGRGLGRGRGGGGDTGGMQGGQVEGHVACASREKKRGGRFVG